MKSIMALLSAVWLCAHGAALAQSAPASAASAPTAASPAGKPTLTPPKPGSDRQAKSEESGPDNCPRGPDGEEECTVVVNGTSRGAGGGIGGGGSTGGPQTCGSSKVLQAAPCTPDTPGAGGETPTAPTPTTKLQRCQNSKAQCIDDAAVLRDADFKACEKQLGTFKQMACNEGVMFRYQKTRDEACVAAYASCMVNP